MYKPVQNNSGPIEVKTLTFPHFSEYVESINIYTFKNTRPVFFLPEGRIELILQLGHSIQYKTVKSGDWQSRPASFIGGLHTKSYYVKPSEAGVSIVGIKFKPTGARYFIEENLYSFKDNLGSLKNNFCEASLNLLARINPETSEADLLQIINQFLKSNYRNPSISPIDHAIKEMEDSKGFCTISTLASKFKFSDSQFRKRFCEEVGLSPKSYSKILRILNAHSIILQRNTLNFTQIAYELGYYDQAHFIKDFKSLVQISPGQYYSQMLSA